jgi:hypothetical protein
MSNVKELITNVKDDDLVAAKTAFDALMSSKINGAMDAKKVELGSTVIDRVHAKQEAE